MPHCDPPDCLALALAAALALAYIDRLIDEAITRCERELA